MMFVWWLFLLPAAETTLTQYDFYGGLNWKCWEISWLLPITLICIILTFRRGSKHYVTQIHLMVGVI
jgi:hypothetical protein